MSAWATAGMDFCTRRGLIAGVGNNSLAPHATLTRDQIGVLLYACTQKASRTR
ncbi:MAG: S-layer homology domain-containing protein [Oscillospiraceae bacterium]|nr:S-layer homology domain-containing protein [Oscillospiraceae bacterium]